MSKRNDTHAAKDVNENPASSAVTRHNVRKGAGVFWERLFDCFWMISLWPRAGCSARPNAGSRAIKGPPMQITRKSYDPCAVHVTISSANAHDRKSRETFECDGTVAHLRVERTFPADY